MTRRIVFLRRLGFLMHGGVGLMLTRLVWLELDDLLLAHLRALLLWLLRNHACRHNIGAAGIVRHLRGPCHSFRRLVSLQILISLLIWQSLSVFLILLSVIMVFDNFLCNIWHHFVGVHDGAGLVLVVIAWTREHSGCFGRSNGSASDYLGVDVSSGSLSLDSLFHGTFSMQIIQILATFIDLGVLRHLTSLHGLLVIMAVMISIFVWLNKGGLLLQMLVVSTLWFLLFQFKYTLVNFRLSNGLDVSLSVLRRWGRVHRIPSWCSCGSWAGLISSGIILSHDLEDAAILVLSGLTVGRLSTLIPKVLGQLFETLNGSWWLATVFGQIPLRSLLWVWLTSIDICLFSSITWSGGLFNYHGILELVLNNVFLINIVKDEIFTGLIHITSCFTYEAWLRNTTVSRIAIVVLYHLVAYDRATVLSRGDRRRIFGWLSLIDHLWARGTNKVCHIFAKVPLRIVVYLLIRWWVDIVVF